MAELKSGGNEGGLWIPDMPAPLVQEFQGFLEGMEANTDDERFDVAYDFISHHDTHGPHAEVERDYGEGHADYHSLQDTVVELNREWAYALIEAIGKPYGGEPKKGVEKK